MKAKRGILMMVIFLLLAASYLSCSRRAENHPSQGDHLVWNKITDDWGAPGSYRYRKDEPRLIVITDQASVSLIQGQLRPDHLEMVADVDFSTYLVLIVYQGEKYTTGYSVEVTDIERNKDTILIHADFHEPAPGEVRGETVTSPYCVLKVKKTENLKNSFVFVLIANGEEVTRQTSTIH